MSTTSVIIALGITALNIALWVVVLRFYLKDGKSKKKNSAVVVPLPSTAELPIPKASPKALNVEDIASLAYQELLEVRRTGKYDGKTVSIHTWSLIRQRINAIKRRRQRSKAGSSTRRNQHK